VDLKNDLDQGQRGSTPFVGGVSNKFNSVNFDGLASMYSTNSEATATYINMDAVSELGHILLRIAEATTANRGFGCAKLVIFSNIPEDNPFIEDIKRGIFQAYGEIRDFGFDIDYTAMQNNDPYELAALIRGMAERKVCALLTPTYDSDEVRDALRLAGEIAARHGRLPVVESVVLGGSRSTGSAVPGSDIDLYVYLREELLLEIRRQVPAGRSVRAEIGNRFWRRERISSNRFLSAALTARKSLAAGFSPIA
jgi:hypothetical protein